MREKITIVYPYDELTEEVKEKAVENLWDINVDCEWWEQFVYNDAINISMEITEFDLDYRRYVCADISDPIYTAEKILENHGEKCDTYKLAKAFLKRIAPLLKKRERVENILNLHERHCLVDLFYKLKEQIEKESEEFKKDLCEEYASILQKEYDYLTSREAIEETIRANEYEFTEDGRLA
jgi:hypothetical protein